MVPHYAPSSYAITCAPLRYALGIRRLRSGADDPSPHTHGRACARARLRGCVSGCVPVLLSDCPWAWEQACAPKPVHVSLRAGHGVAGASDRPATRRGSASDLAGVERTEIVGEWQLGMRVEDRKCRFTPGCMRATNGAGGCRRVSKVMGCGRTRAGRFINIQVYLIPKFRDNTPIAVSEV